MTVGVCRVELQIPANRSLKEKRRVVKSLKDRVQGRFEVAIAEVDRLEEYQRATLGIAYVSNDARHADAVLAKVIGFIQGSPDALVLDYEIDLIRH